MGIDRDVDVLAGDRREPEFQRLALEELQPLGGFVVAADRIDPQLADRGIARKARHVEAPGAGRRQLQVEPRPAVIERQGPAAHRGGIAGLDHQAAQGIDHRAQLGALHRHVVGLGLGALRADLRRGHAAAAEGDVARPALGVAGIVEAVALGRKAAAGDLAGDPAGAARVGDEAAEPGRGQGALHRESAAVDGGVEARLADRQADDRDAVARRDRLLGPGRSEAGGERCRDGDKGENRSGHHGAKASRGEGERAAFGQTGQTVRICGDRADRSPRRAA